MLGLDLERFWKVEGSIWFGLLYCENSILRIWGEFAERLLTGIENIYAFT